MQVLCGTCVRACTLAKDGGTLRAAAWGHLGSLLVRQATILTASGFMLLPEGSGPRLMVEDCPK